MTKATVIVHQDPSTFDNDLAVFEHPSEDDWSEVLRLLGEECIRLGFEPAWMRGVYGVVCSLAGDNQSIVARIDTTPDTPELTMTFTHDEVKFASAGSTEAEITP